MKEEISNELKRDAEEFVNNKIAPFMQDFLVNYETWCDKYGPEAATETASRLFAYLIHVPLTGLKEEGAAKLINDISQRAFSMFMKVKKEEVSNNNELIH